MVETAGKPSATHEPKSTPAHVRRPLDELRQEIDQAFDSFARGDWLRPFRSLAIEPRLRGVLGMSAPAIDVVEKDTAFEVTAELPGILPKDMDVSVNNGSLVIKGEKKDERKEETRDHYLHEREYGSFERSFAIPDGVDESAIEATFNNGVLKVTLPKTLEAQRPAKKIEVKAA